MIWRRLAKDSAIYGGADFLTKLISFFFFPLIAAALSPSAFGAVELITTATALLGLGVNCGLNNAVQRFYWDADTTEAMRPAIVTSGLYAQVVFAIIAVTAGLLAIPWVMPLVKKSELPLTWIALVSALLIMALSQWSQYALDVLRLHFTPWRFLIFSLVSRVVSIGFGLGAVVLLGLGIDGLLGAQALVLLLIVPLALWMIRKDFRPGDFDRKWLIELVQFGYPFIYSGIAFWLLTSIDRWMLASMASVKEVGIYSVALRFSTVVMFVSAAFGQAWSPVAVKITADHPEKYRAIFGQVLLLILFVMLAVGGSIALFAGELILLIMPPEYIASALPLVILCFCIVLQSTQQVTAIGISLERKTYAFARMGWISAGVNFIGNWFLIPTYGAAGAAWATLISSGVLTAGYLYYTQQLHPLHLQWKRLAALSGIGIFVCVASVVFLAVQFDGIVIIIKIVTGCLLLVLGWHLIPIKSMKQIGLSKSSE